MFDDNVMELLLVIAQHAHAVCALPSCYTICPKPSSPVLTSHPVVFTLHCPPCLPAPPSLHCILSLLHLGPHSQQAVITAQLTTYVISTPMTAPSYLHTYSTGLDFMKVVWLVPQQSYCMQRPFKSEAPLLMEIFQQVFKGATATDLAKAAAPTAPQQQPGQSRRAVVRPKGTASPCSSSCMSPALNASICRCPHLCINIVH